MKFWVQVLLERDQIFVDLFQEGSLNWKVDLEEAAVCSGISNVNIHAF